jgi:hypothetical protein
VTRCRNTVAGCVAIRDRDARDEPQTRRIASAPGESRICATAARRRVSVSARSLVVPALIAVAFAGTGAGAAAASTITVYGGKLGGELRIPLALQLNSGVDDMLDPLGRITMAAPAQCQHGLGSVLLSVNLPIPSPFNLPSDVDLLIGGRGDGGRFNATGARIVPFGESSGLVDEHLDGRVVGRRATGS